MKKLAWIDTETTGLSSFNNELIQLAVLIEIDGNVVEALEFKAMPTKWDKIQQGALDTHGYSMQDLRNFPPAAEGFNRLKELLEKHVDPFDKDDKLMMAGHNVKFDQGFVKSFFYDNDNKFFSSYFDYHTLDTMPLIGMLKYFGLAEVESLKLEKMCEFFNINLVAHDALNDIRATRECFLKMKQFLKIKGE